MSELQKPEVRSEVYRLEGRQHSVSTAKSQFAEEHDIPYSNVKGKMIDRPGYGRKFPAYCVVVEVDE